MRRPQHNRLVRLVLRFGQIRFERRQLERFTKPHVIIYETFAFVGAVGLHAVYGHYFDLWTVHAFISDSYRKPIATKVHDIAGRELSSFSPPKHTSNPFGFIASLIRLILNGRCVRERDETEN